MSRTILYHRLSGIQACSKPREEDQILTHAEKSCLSGLLTRVSYPSRL
jgi:hypothetical protein